MVASWFRQVSAVVRAQRRDCWTGESRSRSLNADRLPHVHVVPAGTHPDDLVVSACS